jgi:hypothetical protein
MSAFAEVRRADVVAECADTCARVVRRTPKAVIMCGVLLVAGLTACRTLLLLQERLVRCAEQ